ncbi:MAG TPA: hypothetical protein VIV60_08160 [Polyangiaceae bacterium]
MTKGDAEIQMNAHQAVMNFRDFLCAAYQTWFKSAQFPPLPGTSDFLDAFDDWAQANWELLVERHLCRHRDFLVIYGAGSDYEEDRHSRVFFHDALPTQEVVCQASGTVAPVDILTDTQVNVTICQFDRFVSLDGSWYASTPPFDHVLLKHGTTEYVVPIAAVQFVLRST